MTGLFDSSILSIRNLSFVFQGKEKGNTIFQDISLEVEEGEFVSIIGASGSGKSTLFKLISGLLEPSKGQIWMNGQVAEKRLGKVGYMPQKDLLMPWRTIIDNVMLPLELTKEKNKKSEVMEWLSRFGLNGYEKAYPHELSGGMRQRVAFLRTIMTGKELLLLDEPFGALDSLTKRNMHKWLLELWDGLQKTVLFITHDLEEAILLSDRIYLLQGADASSVKEIKVELPRPRNPEIIYQAEFIEMRKELEWLIRDEG